MASRSTGSTPKPEDGHGMQSDPANGPIGRSKEAAGSFTEVNTSTNPDSERSISEMQTVAVFGKTGDGKSTLCNMLLFSDPEGEFETGTGLGSVSQQVVTRSKDNWTVIDTIGLGDALKDSKTASNDALSKLKNFLATEKMDVDHICYVFRKGEFTKYERLYWECFLEMFRSPTYEKHIRLIFTSAGEKWLHENGDAIKELIGDYPMISVDFPPRDDDIHLEEQYRKKREQNLTGLRNFLCERKRSTGEPVRIGQKASRHRPNGSNEPSNSSGCSIS